MAFSCSCCLKCIFLRVTWPFGEKAPWKLIVFAGNVEPIIPRKGKRQTNNRKTIQTQTTKMKEMEKKYSQLKEMLEFQVAFDTLSEWSLFFFLLWSRFRFFSLSLSYSCSCARACSSQSWPYFGARAYARSHSYFQSRFLFLVLTLIHIATLSVLPFAIYSIDSPFLLNL